MPEKPKIDLEKDNTKTTIERLAKKELQDKISGLIMNPDINLDQLKDIKNNIDLLLSKKIQIYGPSCSILSLKRNYKY